MSAFGDDPTGTAGTTGPLLYENPWMSLVDIGGGGGECTFVIVAGPDGRRRSGGVALVTDGESILMVKQERPAVGAVTWELPRGAANSGEPGGITGLRETTEETGVALGDFWIPLGTMMPDTGIVNSEVNLVLVRVKDKAVRYARDGEVSAVAWLPVEDVVDACASGNIACAFTCVTVLRARARKLI